jgi:hypothetical protein
MFGQVWVNIIIVFFTMILINPKHIKILSYIQEKNIYIKGIFGMMVVVWGLWDFYFSLTDLPLFIKWMPFRATVFIANFLFFIVSGFVMAYPMLSKYFVSEKETDSSRRIKLEEKVKSFGNKYSTFGIILIIGLFLVAFHIFN